MRRMAASRQEQVNLYTSPTRGCPSQNGATECSLVVLDESDLAATADDTGPSGGDETDLLTTGSVSPGGRGVTNVLMVTTTMRMFDGVHGNTSDDGPIALLGVGLVVSLVGLEHRLIASSATGANADHSSAATDDGLTDA